MGIFKDIKALISGLGIAGKHLGRHAITLQYPEQKMEMPERSRGIVVLLSDLETGELNCTGCVLCEKACPTAAIDIDAPRDPETKKRTVKKFTLDHALCCFCGLCEEACNFAAIKMATKYELSTDNKDDLFWDMDKLQQMGLDVKYEPKKKKKKPAPKKAAKPADGEAPAKEEVKEKEPKVQENEPEAPKAEAKEDVKETKKEVVEEARVENKEDVPKAPQAPKEEVETENLSANDVKETKVENKQEEPKAPGEDKE